MNGFDSAAFYVKVCIALEIDGIINTVKTQHFIILMHKIINLQSLSIDIGESGYESYLTVWCWII